MVAAASQPTLLEDWSARRQRLAGAAATDQHAQFQLKLLDYLIRRYGRCAVANMPARYPLGSKPQSSVRAIVVHQELSRRRQGNVRSQGDAQYRVRSIVRRMSGDTDLPATDRDDERAGKLATSPDDPPALDHESALWCQSQRGLIAADIANGYDALPAIAGFLQVSPHLPPVALQYLSDRAGNPTANDWVSAQLLCCHRGKNVDHAFWAWRRRVATGRIDETTDELRRFLLRPEVRQESAERMRTALTDDHGSVRLEATAFLGRIGSLDDISLFIDLLALPPTADEDPRERQGMLLAMQRISAMPRDS
jgi:hypothetical protein